MPDIERVAAIACRAPRVAHEVGLLRIRVRARARVRGRGRGRDRVRVRVRVLTLTLTFAQLNWPTSQAARGTSSPSS